MSEVPKYTRAEIMMPGVACVQEGASHDRQSISAKHLAIRACGNCLQAPVCREEASAIAAHIGAAREVTIGGIAVSADAEAIQEAQQREPTYAFVAKTPPSDPQEAAHYFRVLNRSSSELRSLSSLEESVLPLVVDQLTAPEHFDKDLVSELCKKITSIVSTGEGFPLSTVQDIAETILADAVTYIENGMSPQEALVIASKFKSQGQRKVPSHKEPRSQVARAVKVEKSTEPPASRTRRIERKKMQLLAGRNTTVSKDELNKLGDQHSSCVLQALENWQDRSISAKSFTQVRQRARKGLEEIILTTDEAPSYDTLAQLLTAELLMAMTRSGSIRRSPKLGLQLAQALGEEDFSTQIAILENVESLLEQGAITIQRTKEDIALTLHPALEALSDRERFFFKKSKCVQTLFPSALPSENYASEEAPENLEEKIKILIANASQETAGLSPIEQGVVDMLAEAVEYFGGRHTEEKSWLLEQLRTYCGIEPAAMQTDVQFSRFLKSFGKAYARYHHTIRNDLPMSDGELVLAGMFIGDTENELAAHTYANIAIAQGFDPSNTQLRESFAHAFDEFLDGIEQDHRLHQQRKALVRQWRLDDPEVEALIARVPEVPKNISTLNVEFAKKMEAGREAAMILSGEGTSKELEDTYGIIDSSSLTSEQQYLLERAVAVGARARKDFIEANIRLGASIALSPRFRGRGLEAIELVQQSIVGIGLAVDRYDHTRGTTFSTYARYWVIQTLNRTIQNTARTIRLPVEVERQRGHVFKARRQLVNDLNKEPTVQQIAARVAMTPEKVTELLNLGRKPDSFSRPLDSHETEGDTIGDMLTEAKPNEKDDFESVLDAVDTEFLGHFLQGLRQSEMPEPQKGSAGYTEAMELYKNLLTEKEFTILWRRFGFGGAPETMEEIGSFLGLTRQAVSQKHTKALQKLRGHLLHRLQGGAS